MYIGLDPDLLKLGGFVVSWHGLMTFVAVALAVFLIARRSRGVGILPDVVFATAVWAIIGGVIGARVVHVIDRWDFYRNNLTQLHAVWNGGIAIFGAVLGGFVGGWLYIWWKNWSQSRALKHVADRYANPTDIQEREGYVYLRFPANHEENLPAIAKALGGELAEGEGRRTVRIVAYRAGKLADLSAPAVVLAMAVGRIGDVINGEHVGNTTTMIWGFTYTHPASPTNQVHGVMPTHPTPLYEMLWDFVVLGMLWYLKDRLRPSGMLFALFLAMYSVGRFFISFLRMDKDWLAGLDQAQLIALVVLAVTIPLLAYRAQLVRRPVRPGRKAKAESPG